MNYLRCQEGFKIREGNKTDDKIVGRFKYTMKICTKYYIILQKYNEKNKKQ